MNEDIGYESAFVDNRNEEEANFYWVLGDFEELVAHYGAKQVLKEMDKEVVNALRVALHQLKG